MDFEQNAFNNMPSKLFGWHMGQSALSGLFGLANTGLSYYTSKKLAEQQNKMQLDWWNMQNEYNTPKNQVKRLLEAGLNPNLAYGQLSSSNAGDVGTPRTAEVAFNQNPISYLVDGLNSAMSLLNNYEDVRSKQLDNDNKVDLLSAFDLDKFSNRREYYTYVNKLKTDFLDYRNKGIQLQNDYNSRTLDDRVKLAFFKRELANNSNMLLNLKSRNWSLINKYQEEVNSWYTANQVFNMVNAGINTIFSNFVVPFLPKKAMREIFMRKDINYNKFY